jgi:RNA polymerase sigma-70 factor (ECF subfamily)
MDAEIGQEMVAILPRLRRFARSLAGSAEAADDLVQAACERALRAIDSWQPGTRLDSWMYRIIRNLWIDDLRRKRFTGDDGELATVAGEDGRRTTEARFALAEVRALIAALPAQQREVLVLVCVEELSYRETAAILGVPIGTVMSRLARARLALGERLGGDEGAGEKVRSSNG